MKSKHLVIAIILLASLSVHALSQPDKPGDPTAENAKNIARNAAVQKAAQDGVAAFQRKDYDAAITIFDAAIKADPDDPGVSALLTDKAIALNAQAAELYNAAIAKKDNAARDAAKAIFRTASESSAKAVAMVKARGIKPEADRSTFTARRDIVRVLVTIGEPMTGDDLITAYKDYLSVESDPAKVLNAHIDLAQQLLSVGDTKRAEQEFEFALSSSPKNATANFGLAMTLVTMGSGNNDKAALQRAANYFKTYLSVAPADDSHRSDATETLTFLKESYNIVPK